MRRVGSGVIQNTSFTYISFATSYTIRKMPALEQPAALAALGPFKNESLTPFHQAGHADDMRSALTGVAAKLGREYRLVIGGKHISKAHRIRSTNPARPGEVVGTHEEADAAAIDLAVRVAADAFESWRWEPTARRASLLMRIAEGIRNRRHEFCAWLVFEVGKNWVEADAEVAEAIDFLEFYAREAIRLRGATPPLQYPGEYDEFFHIPLGVGVVIPPWNFPLAILAGMTMAAVVCGNTVVLKPSPEAPTIAAIFHQLAEECGLPPGVINLCQGGAEAGRALVGHPGVRFIAFTGSKQAGLDIYARAAQTPPGQVWMKRSILEMGGKDAIIVDRDADFELAMEGVLASAFGYNGQKCSACSRLIVDAAVYDSFVAEVTRRAEGIESGDPRENFAMGPVINRAAYDRVLGYIEIGRAEAQLLTGGGALTRPEEGYYLAPAVFGDVAPEARIAQDEIFGPLLAVIRSHNFDHALEIANGTEYGLTGSVYTTCRKKIDKARRHFHVGNLYVNRKCTGAMVGAHPFGGFNMSGTDSKAGGPDYLYLFTQGKSIGERIGLENPAY